MAEKKGRKSEVNPKLVEESNNAKITKMVDETNQKINKMAENVGGNTQEILDIFYQVQELLSGVKVAMQAVEDIQITLDAVKEKEKEFQSEVIEINDQIEKKKAEIRDLKQKLQRKNKKMEEMMTDLKSTMEDHKKVTDLFKQLKSLSNVFCEGISKRLGKIAEKCKEKEIKKQLEVAEDEQAVIDEETSDEADDSSESD